MSKAAFSRDGSIWSRYNLVRIGLAFPLVPLARVQENKRREEARLFELLSVPIRDHFEPLHSFPRTISLN